MAHASDKGCDKWICTEGAALTQEKADNDGSIQRQVEIKIKFKPTHYVCVFNTSS